MDDTASSPSGELVKASLTRVETLETIEVLWNPAVYPPSSFPDGPPIIVTQTERYYPMVSSASASAASLRPQYVWDCMFRRFQGRVLVAIFVYRVAMPGGGGVAQADGEYLHDAGALFGFVVSEDGRCGV